MNFQREKLSLDLFDEMLPLLLKHYKEIAHFQDIPLDPDYDTYIKMEEIDLVRCYTARDNGELVGYAVYFVKANIKYRSSKQATQDVLYIDPNKRGFGHRFILWCDRQLKEEGVQVVYHHTKLEHNFGPMLERQGYQLIDLIFGKRLDLWQ